MHDVNWWLFIAASIVLIVTPGQDMILVMSRSIAQGSAAGVATAAGVSVGLVGHTLLATLGLGAVLRTSEWLFVALKLAGAAYLVVLGVQLLRTRAQQLATAEGVPRSLLRSAALVYENLQQVANSQSGETERRAGVLHSMLRFGTLDTVAAVGMGAFLHDVLTRSADISDRIGRDFLGHVAPTVAGT